MNTTLFTAMITESDKVFSNILLPDITKDRDIYKPLQSYRMWKVTVHKMIICIDKIDICIDKIDICNIFVCKMFGHACVVILQVSIYYINLSMELQRTLPQHKIIWMGGPTCDIYDYRNS